MSHLKSWEEPLTPSHLLLGFRVIILPDVGSGNDDVDSDYDDDLTK